MFFALPGTMERRSAEELPNAAKEAETIVDRHSRIAVQQLGLLMAIWGELKPDVCTDRKKMEALWQQRHNINPEDKWVPPEITGAALIDKDGFLCSVVGSGYTHACISLCAS